MLVGAFFLLVVLASPGAEASQLTSGSVRASKLRGRAPQVNAPEATSLAATASHADILAAVQLVAAQPALAATLLAPAEAAALQGTLSMALGRADIQGAGDVGAFGPGGGAIADFLGLDMEKFTMAALGQSLTIALIIAVIGAIAFEAVHYRWAEADLSLDLQYGHERKESQLTRMFSGIRPLITPYFCQESKCSWYFLMGLACLGIIDLIFGLIFMMWMKEFWDSLEKKKEQKYMKLMMDWCLLVGAWVIVGTYSSYVSMMMSIHWRKFLTDYLLRKWLRAKAFYHLQLVDAGSNGLDNPDQRLQEDVPAFIRLSLQLGGGFLATVGQFCTMLPLLLILSPDYAFGVFYCPGWLVYLALIYSGVGTVAAHVIGNRLILINFALQKYEANFRYYIVQVRDHAESIALYGSEEVERMKIDERFSWLVRCWWMLMRYAKRLSFFTSFYYQSSHTFPYLVLAPNYFKGQITLGTMFMLFSALGSVKAGFDWLIGSYSLLTDYRATVDRLTNFRDAVEAAPTKCSSLEVLEEAPSGYEGAAVVAKDICVQLPGKEEKKLWDKADLVVQPGQFILLSAPEGTGKSCFLRALAGIWPHATGSVFMDKSSLFLPQRPFVAQGTLKQAVAYPEKAENYTDEEVRKALEVVRLDAVKGRELSEDANWELALSGGEQQRLAIAHAVLQRPQVLFLDEATSALSEEGTLEVYNLLRQKEILPEGAAVISISHDLNLLEPVHDVHFRFDTDTSCWKQVTKS
jgi:putative ATP-binding cassette transporter